MTTPAKGPAATATQRSVQPPSEWDDLVETVAGGRSARGWAAAAKGLFTTSRSVRVPEQSARDLRREVPSCRRIVVTSARGGAGRTAITALVGSAFAVRRQDSVVAADADFVTGSLTARLELRPRQPLPDLAGTIQGSDLGAPDLLGMVLPRTPEGLWLVPGGASGDLSDIAAITGAISGPGNGIAVAVTDCGPELTMGNAIGLMVDAHAIIMVTPATPEGVRSTVREFSRIAQTERGRALLTRTVVALNPVVAAGGTLNRRRAGELFERYGTPVVTMSHDDHLAAGAPIDLVRVSEPCVLAATQLAGAALERALAG